VCSHLCLEDKECVATLYDVSLQDCQLFSYCLPDVMSTDSNTDLVYMNKLGIKTKYKGE